MDFLKTLLLYMAMTFASSVQSAPTPQITPAVIATPAGSTVVSTMLPGQTASPSPAPGTTAATPSPAPTAAAPTITPNAAYKTLQKGDRGDRVKKLQEKLIELGYLSGEADGSYGNQTRRAVQRFQYANGLQQDGIAGKATQTILFETEPVRSPSGTQAPATTAPAATAASAAPSPAPSPAAGLTTIAAPAEPTASPTVVPPAAVTASATPTRQAAAPFFVGPQIASVRLATASDASTNRGLTLTEMADASVVLGDSGAPLSFLRLTDGVTVSAKPRVYRTAAGDVLVSLADLCQSIDGWTLTPGQADGAWTFSGAGYTVSLLWNEAAKTFAATEDGKPVALGQTDVIRLEDGSLAVGTPFLTQTLGAVCTWDEEERTLMLRVADKGLVTAAD